MYLQNNKASWGGVHSVEVRNRQEVNQRRSCDRQLTVCSLFWLGLVINEELAEEVAHDHVCML